MAKRRAQLTVTIPPIQAQRPRDSGAPPTWLFVLSWELRAPGGVSQVVQNLFTAVETVLKRRSLMFINTWGQREPMFAEIDGRFTVTARLRSPFHPIRTLRHVLSFLVHLPSTLLFLRRLIIAHNVERITVHYPDLSALVWVLAARLVGARRPLVMLSFHGSDLRQARATRGFFFWLWSRLLLSVDDITACGDGLRRDIHETFGAAAARTRIVHNGVDPILIENLAKSPTRAECPPTFVLSLASIEHKKGLDVLIRAFQTIAAEYPELSLVLAGRTAEPQYLQKLRALIAELDLGQRVSLLLDLPHSEVMPILARAKVLALASRAEPFGIVILEAGILNVPVVATNICGAVRLLEAEQEVISVPPENHAAIAGALRRLLSDEQLSKRLASRLRERVVASFTWRHAVLQFAGTSDSEPAE